MVLSHGFRLCSKYIYISNTQIHSLSVSLVHGYSSKSALKMSALQASVIMVMLKERCISHNCAFPTPKKKTAFWYTIPL